MVNKHNFKKFFPSFLLKPSVISLMLCAITFFTINNSFITNSTPIAQAAGNPLFVIEPVTTTMPAGTATNTLTFDIKVRNAGTDTASDTVINFIVPGSTPLESTSLVNSKVLGSFSPSSTQTVSLSYRIKSSAQIGVYPITVNLNYKNSNGDTRESNETIYVRVIDSLSPITLQLSSFRTFPYTVVTGNSFELQAEFTNKGTQSITNVDVTLDGISASLFTLGEASKKTTGTILAGQTKLITFKMVASDKLDYGSYPLTLRYSYYDPIVGLKEESQQIYIQTQREFYSSVRLKNMVSPSTSVAAGQPFQITFDVENALPRAIENVTVSVDGGDKIIPKTSSIVKVESMNQNEKKPFAFTLQPLEKIEPRPYVITIEVKYLKKGSTTEFESYRETVTIDVSKSSDLTTSNVTTPYTIGEEQEFEFSFDITNNGKGQTANLKSFMELSKGLLAISPTQVNIQTLNAQEKKRITYKLRSTKVTESGIYPIVIKLTSDNSAESQTLNYGIYIEAKGNTKSVPRLILNSYALSSPSVQAGSNFQIKLNLQNTSSAKKISNVKVTISSEQVNDKNVITGSIFVPVQGNSTFFINDLSPSSGLTKTLDYRVLPDAESKNYFMTLNMEYEDELGNPFTAKETITIPVEQQAKMFMTDVFAQGSVIVGQESLFTLKFFNTGRVPMTNFKIQAEGDFEIVTLPYFSIRLDVGADDLYDISIIPKNNGENTGKLLISYNETNGDLKEVVKEFKFNAIANTDSMGTSQPDATTTIPEDEGFNLFSVMNIVLIALILVAGVTFFIIRAKRKKKAGFYE